MGVNKNYIVGILDDRSTIFNKDYGNQFKELTEFFTRFKYFGKILYGKSVNEILDKAVQEELKPLGGGGYRYRINSPSLLWRDIA